MSYLITKHCQCREFYALRAPKYDAGQSNEGKAFLHIGDSMPPVTTISLEGILGENGWYTSDVLVTLTAMDDGSGMDEIQPG